MSVNLNIQDKNVLCGGIQGHAMVSGEIHPQLQTFQGGNILKNSDFNCVTVWGIKVSRFK